MAEVNEKYLKGLTFTGAEEKKVTEEDGRKVKKYIPFERPLTAGDLLSVTERGDSIVLVTKDGRKHVVSKDPKKEDDKGKDEGKGKDDGKSKDDGKGKGK